MDAVTILRFMVGGIFAAGAVYLAHKQLDGWGWFTFAAVAITSSLFEIK